MAKINGDNYHQWIPMVVEYHGDVPKNDEILGITLDL